MHLYSVCNIKYIILFVQSYSYHTEQKIVICVLCDQDEARTNYIEKETSDDEIIITTVIKPQEKYKQM